jgi:hypothetical protein
MYTSYWVWWNSIQVPSFIYLPETRCTWTHCNVDLRGMIMWILRYVCCTGDQMCSLKDKILFSGQILNLVVSSNCFHKVYVDTNFQAWHHGVSGHPLVLDNNYTVHIQQWFTLSMKTIAWNH